MERKIVEKMVDFQLTRLRGDNPLGFLAALGALQTLDDAKIEAFLFWDGFTPWLKVKVQDEAIMQKNICRDFLTKTLYKTLKRKRKGKNTLDPITVVKDNSVNFTNDKLYKYAKEAASKVLNGNNRPVDLLASFCVKGPKETVEKSNWILTTGQGHQSFFKIERNIIEKITEANIKSALFGPPNEKDKGRLISFRWDPEEDRRYALIESDPSDKETLTVLGANALAFEALRSFPAFVIQGKKLGMVAWNKTGDTVRWPLWKYPIEIEVVKSLLRIPEIWEVPDRSESKEKLLKMGVFAVVESKRINVDRYRNMVPGIPVWLSL